MIDRECVRLTYSNAVAPLHTACDMRDNSWTVLVQVEPTGASLNLCRKRNISIKTTRVFPRRLISFTRSFGATPGTESDQGLLIYMREYNWTINQCLFTDIYIGQPVRGTVIWNYTEVLQIWVHILIYCYDNDKKITNYLIFLEREAVLNSTSFNFDNVVSASRAPTPRPHAFLISIWSSTWWSFLLIFLSYL